MLAFCPITYGQNVLFKNAFIYNPETSGQIANNVLVGQGKFLAIGTEEEIKSKYDISSVVDLENKLIMPSFHDNHMHPIEGGIETIECYLGDVETKKDLIDTIKKCDKRLPKTETWIRGSGWSIYGALGSFIHKSFLDNLNLKHPVAFSSADGHSYWVDSKALELAKIKEDSIDPPFGKFGRDENGHLNGVLYESAIDIVEDVMPRRPPEKLKTALLKSIQFMHSFGITSFKDASVTDDTIVIYKELAAQNKLKVDIELSILSDNSKEIDQLEHYKVLRSFYSNEKLKINTVKIYLDGVIEDKTAALLRPYKGTNIKGEMSWEIKKLKEFVIACDREKFQVHFHAIGDAAIRAALDGIEAARINNKNSDITHEIAHLQLINPADLKRFGVLNINAVFAPLWAVRDATITNFAEPLLGPVRSKWLYSIASVQKNGGKLVFGSDWSVTSMDPFGGIHNIFNRTWIPKEKIALKDAINGYLKPSSRIEIGKEASFIVLDKNILEIHPSKINTIDIERTYYKGELVFKKN